MLETKRLILRPWQETDAESLYEFGIRYYEEFLKFKPVSSGYQDKAVENDSERTFMENL